MVQPVDDTIGAHRDTGQAANQSADAIVETTIGEQSIVGRFVQENEERMLLRPQQHNTEKHYPPLLRPYRQRHENDDERQGLQDGTGRAESIERGQFPQALGRQPPPLNLAFVGTEVLATRGERFRRLSYRGLPRVGGES